MGISMDNIGAICMLIGTVVFINYLIKNEHENTIYKNQVNEIINLIKQYNRKLKSDFPKLKYQDYLWNDVIILEINFILLIVWFNIMTADNHNHHKDRLINDVFKKFISEFYNKSSNRFDYNNVINKRIERYSEGIRNIVQERIYRHPVNENLYKYSLYQDILDCINENLDKNSPKYELIRSLVYNETLLTGTLLFGENPVNGISDKTINTNDRNNTKNCATFIRDMIVDFSNQCIIYRRNNNFPIVK